MNPSIILIGSTKPILNNIINVTYFFKSITTEYYEKISGIHKLHRHSKESEEEGEFDTSYLCWETNEKLTKIAPPYFAELSFIEPIPKDFKITEIWVTLTHRYSKGYKVKSKRVDKTIYLTINSVIEEELI